MSRYDPVIWSRDLHAMPGERLRCRSLVGRQYKLKRLLFTSLAIPDCCEWAADAPQLIHAHFGPDAAMVLPLAMRHRIPLVVTFHGFDAQRSRLAQLAGLRPSNILFLLRERKLYRYAAKIIAVSEYLKGCLIRRGCPADKITVHYIGVDTRKFVPDVRRRRPFRIINVARHIPLKGIDTILRAFGLIVEKFPGAEFVQVGSGPESDSLAALARRLGIADRVTWLGPQSNEQVLEAMQSSSIYVQASRRDKAGQTEAFGIALLEAQACGLPVVATNSGGIPEALIIGKTGLLFAESDHRGLADRICELLESPERAGEMGRCGREMVIERFDIRTRTGILEQLYDEVLARYPR